MTAWPSAPPSGEAMASLPPPVARYFAFVDQHGTPEMASASLQRFLAEAVWVPTALLPRAGLSWPAIDDASARVTLTDGATTVSLDARSGANGEIGAVSAMRDHRIGAAGWST